MHAAHFHGHTLSENGRNADSFKLIPSVMRTTTLVPDNPGVWLYHCHVRSPCRLVPLLRTQSWSVLLQQALHAGGAWRRWYPLALGISW